MRNGLSTGGHDPPSNRRRAASQHQLAGLQAKLLHRRKRRLFRRHDEVDAVVLFAELQRNRLGLGQRRRVGIVRSLGRLGAALGGQDIDGRAEVKGGHRHRARPQPGDAELATVVGLRRGDWPGGGWVGDRLYYHREERDGLAEFIDHAA